ncbi:hypothetical protein D3C87_87210 [compost metagenome]
MKIITLLFLSFLALSGCNKPDPTPELKDPIYGDLNSRLGAVTAELSAEKKVLEGHQLTLSQVTPQTGQIKYAQKRVYESQAKITKMEQEKQYLELKIQERKKESRRSYNKAFQKGETWPDMAEYDSYKAEIRLRNAKRTWDVKERMKSAGILESKAPAAEKTEGGSH